MAGVDDLDADGLDDFAADVDDGALGQLLRAVARAPALPAPIGAAHARMGPYVLVERLGKGGMGEVWRARDTRLARDVALKLVRVDANAAVLLREARAAAAVQHEHVAVVYDVAEVVVDNAGGPDGAGGDVVGVIASELVLGEDGGSLRAALAAGPLPWRRALRVARDVARGLAAVHARGLVHQDIKPDNIARTKSGDAKLLDFGVATSVDDGGAVRAGTLRYMSPEQRSGAHATPAADVWAWAVTVVELLTAHAPFLDDGALRPPLVSDALASVRAREREGVPPVLTALLARCLSGVDVRPKDGAALCRALEPVLVPPPSRPAQLWTFATVVALGALLLSAATTLDRERGPPLPPFLRATPTLLADTRTQTRFRAAAVALADGEDVLAADLLVDVVQQSPEEAWPYALLLYSGEFARAGLSKDIVVARARAGDVDDVRAAFVDVAAARAASADAFVDVACGACGDVFVDVLAGSVVGGGSVDVDVVVAGLDAIAARDPRAALPHLQKARALLAAGRADDAVVALDRALATLPNQPRLEALRLAARARSGTTDVDAVAVDVAAARAARRDDVDVAAAALWLALRQGRRDDVERGVRALLTGGFALRPATRAALPLARALADDTLVNDVDAAVAALGR